MILVVDHDSDRCICCCFRCCILFFNIIYMITIISFAFLLFHSGYGAPILPIILVQLIIVDNSLLSALALAGCSQVVLICDKVNQ